MQYISVDILPPANWYRATRYRLRSPVIAGGHIAPPGFITDGATVPRFLSLVGAILVLVAYQIGSLYLVGLGLLLLLAIAAFPRVGRYIQAAIIHDYLLERYPTDRHLADRAFMEAMRELRIATWRRWVMFICVWCWSEVVMGYDKTLKL